VIYVLSVDAERRIAELEAELAAKDARIAVLERQVATLTELLGQTSRNSHKPPSSDEPGARGERQGKPKSLRRRGGQPGHEGNRRELLPPEQVDRVVDLYPSRCENCWRGLPQLPDAAPKRHQHTELPPIKPETTEYRRHEVECPDCGFCTRAPYDEATVPSSPFGPRLMALMALLTGVYHLSRRRAVELLSDVVGVRVSTGALSAVEGRVSEAVLRWTPFFGPLRGFDKVDPAWG
jgi:transposase